MSLATLQEFLDRVDAGLIFDLTIDRKLDDENPATAPELATRAAKCQTALDDASATILGFKPLIASSLWPDADLLRSHVARIALHLLTGRRVGGDYKSIHEAHDAVVAFYEKLIARTDTQGDAGVSHDAPPFAFTDDTLKGFTGS